MFYGAVWLATLATELTPAAYMFHVNRNTFGTESWEQDLSIARVLYFFKKYWEKLLKFSHRTPLCKGAPFLWSDGKTDCGIYVVNF